LRAAPRSRRDAVRHHPRGVGLLPARRASPGGAAAANYRRRGFQQRFDSAVRLNLDFRALLADGAFASSLLSGRATFHLSPDVTDTDVERLLRAVGGRGCGTRRARSTRIRCLAR
jgi:hypothetical protein